MAPSEDIYAALFATVSQASGLVTRSRRYRHYEDVSPAEKPALFQREPEREATQTLGLPPKWILRASLLIYVYSDTANDPERAPSTLLNQMVDSVIATLAPDTIDRLTFGGMVSYCRIATGGKIIHDEGLLDPHGIAVIPIEILATI